jgi:hypothetical protein
MADVMQVPQMPQSQHDDQSSMPPPTSTPTSASAAAAAAARRPPRKSTLTQQQKNQKRQRATQDQLITLEVEFNKNPTPTALVRERIASDISMTERSVQIWFQNRYVPSPKGVSTNMLTNFTDVQRSRTLPSEASRAAKTATAFPNR